MIRKNEDPEEGSAPTHNQTDRNTEAIISLMKMVSQLQKAQRIHSQQGKESLHRLAELNTEDFEEMAKGGMFPSLRKDELRALRILQNWDKGIEKIYLPRYTPAGYRVETPARCFQCVRSGTNRLGDLLALYEAPVHSEQRIRAMACAAMISENEEVGARIEELGKKVNRPSLLGPRLTFRKNRMINPRARTSKENFIGKKNEYLLFDRDDNEARVGVDYWQLLEEPFSEVE